MLNKDLLLNNEHDLMINDFDLQLTNNQNVIKQRLKQALLTFKGNWFLDANLGVPYYEQILGHKNSLTTARSILINAINNVDGVKELKSFDIDLDANTRNVKVEFTVVDIFGNELTMEI